MTVDKELAGKAELARKALAQEEAEAHRFDHRIAQETEWLRRGGTARRRRNQGRLRRLHGRFRAMVLPGTEITVEHAAGRDGAVHFVVRNHRDEPAIDQCYAVIG